MSEVSSPLFPVTFNKSLKIETRPERLSSDGGAIVLREIDEQLKTIEDIAYKIIDPRDRKTITYQLIELLRTRIYLIAQGWKDADDADHLRNDPAFITATSQYKGQTPLKTDNINAKVPDGLASQPTLSRLTEMLSTEENRKTLRNSLVENARRHVKATRKHRYQHCTLDVDSLDNQVYGHQKGSKYNRYYNCICYHIITAMLAETGHVLDIKLREGNVHSADGLCDFLFPLIEEVKGKIGIVTSVRGDAAMPFEESLAGLEERRIHYAFRIKNNNVLKQMAEPYVSQAIRENSDDWKEAVVELSYQAKVWSVPRRIVLVIVKQDQIELFEPYNYFFLVANWTEDEMSGYDILDFYRKRGTMERWIGEFKDTLAPSLSCASRKRKSGGTVKERDDFACNEALLLLYALAYNLLNTARRLMEKATGKGWSLRRFREQVLKTAVHFTLSSRRIWAWITRSSAELWQLLGRRITRLRPIRA